MHVTRKNIPVDIIEHFDKFINAKWFCSNYHISSLKYSFDLSWSGIIVFAPGFHPAGQTTPCSSACWKAFIVLKVSSTFLPTCSSLIVTDLTTPFPSMMNKPLKVAPFNGSAESYTRTPYSLDIYFVMSATRGISRWPKPPFYLAVFLQAKCEKWESTEIAKTSAPISENKKDHTSKVFCVVSVTDNFSRADICEVEGIEQKNDIFSLKVGELYFREGVIG